VLKNNIIKIIVLSLLLSSLFANFYFLTYKKDTLTQHKTDFFSSDGQSRFLGRLNLWYFFASRGDWQQASNFETDLNQVETFKKNNQPDQLEQLLNQLEVKSNKDAQDYLHLAKIQSSLGYHQQAVESIKKAHQLDPIRSDLDKLFYSTVDF
jgi:tetratricopeptide (TPR) repeat protein